MGNAGAQAFGLEKAQITLDESIPGMVNVVCIPKVFRRLESLQLARLGESQTAFLW